MKIDLIKLWLVLILAISPINFAMAADDEVLDFDTLKVSATERVKNEEKPFLTPGAVSVREGINTSTRSLDSIIRSVPGTFTQIDQAQGTVSVNIRSMTGLGRVDTMVDGVTQTYFGTSADSGSHPFGGIGTSAFGSTIDSNLLVGMDVQRGGFNGGSSGLMGSANFRTISVNDVVREGENFGFLGKYSYGSNKVGPSYMGSFAAKQILENGGFAGVLFAYSGKKISQDYSSNKGTLIDSDGDGVNDTLLTAYNASQLTQTPRTYMLKAEYVNDEHSANLMFRKHDNFLAQRDIDDKVYQLNYSFNPDNDFINLKTLFAYTDSLQRYSDEATLGFLPIYMYDGGLAFANKSINIKLSNEIYKEFNNNLSFRSEFGLNILRNKYERKTNDNDFIALMSAFVNPDGKQNVTTYFIDNTAIYDIFSFGANFNLIDWELKGKKASCDPLNYLCYPKEAGNLKVNDTDYGIYLIGSANISDYFSPFISWSRTIRALNVQELFTSGMGYDSAINTGLRPEVAKTWQIGFNSFFHDIFTSSDTFGFKTIYFDSKIKDYIYDRLVGYDGSLGADAFLARLNGNARLKGVELEANYDSANFYTKLTYSYQKSDLPYSESNIIDYGLGPSSGQSQFAELPRHYATLDAGVKFFNERLIIGASAKYTGKAKRVTPDQDMTNTGTSAGMDQNIKYTQNLPKIPTIVDFYANFDVTKNFKIKFEVQNLFDKNYMDALYTYNSTSYGQDIGTFGNPVYIYNNNARGRTAIFSLEYRY
ncbi:MAG: TonB-dependent receptor [Campylobacter sp.]|nr:TonB-dependent receptor [Campylobacter sp.]